LNCISIFDLACLAASVAGDVWDKALLEMNEMTSVGRAWWLTGSGLSINITPFTALPRRRSWRDISKAKTPPKDQP
jgi:hypothetical protein